MSDLKAIIITNLKNSPDFIQYFPIDSGNEYKNHLITISDSIKTYGNGYLQNKNGVYYYKTFTFQNSNMVLFLLIYFQLPYKRKYIEKVSEEIYEIIDNNKDKFSNGNIDNNISKIINKVYYKYCSIENDDEEHEEENILKNVGSLNSYTRKYIFSRINNKEEKSQNELGNTFTHIPKETELTFLLNGKNINNYKEIIIWKRFKRNWLIIFIIIFVILCVLLGLYLYYLKI
jgi:hypothetical protein